MTIRRQPVSLTLDGKILHKLRIIYTVDRFFFRHNKVTMSGIVDKALEEYFENHKDELDAMMKEYHEKGGCFEL